MHIGQLRFYVEKYNKLIKEISRRNLVVDIELIKGIQNYLGTLIPTYSCIFLYFGVIMKKCRIIKHQVYSIFKRNYSKINLAMNIE